MSVLIGSGAFVNTNTSDSGLENFRMFSRIDRNMSQRPEYCNQGNRSLNTSTSIGCCGQVAQKKLCRKRNSRCNHHGSQIKPVSYKFFEASVHMHHQASGSQSLITGAESDSSARLAWSNLPPFCLAQLQCGVGCPYFPCSL